MADQPPRASNETLSAADQIIGLATKEQKEQSARSAIPPPPPLRPRVTRWGLAFSLPTLVVVLIVNLTGFEVDTLFEVDPPPAVARQRAERVLKDLVAEVELFRRDYNALPETLVEVGLPERGTWTYTRSDGRFRIHGTLFSQSVSFESADAPAPAEAPPSTEAPPPEPPSQDAR